MNFPFGRYRFLISMEKRIHPNWRYGQVLFNVLYDNWPEIADFIQGTNLDPFHFEDASKPPITDFFDYLIELDIEDEDT